MQKHNISSKRSYDKTKKNEYRGFESYDNVRR